MSLHEALRHVLGNDPKSPKKAFRPKSDEEARQMAAHLPEEFRLVEIYSHYPLGVPKEAQQLLDTTTGEPLLENTEAEASALNRAGNWRRRRVEEWQEEVTLYQKTYDALEVRVELTERVNHYGGSADIRVVPIETLACEKTEDKGSYLSYRACVVKFPCNGASDMEIFEKDHLPAVVKMMREHRIKTI